MSNSQERNLRLADKIEEIDYSDGSVSMRLWVTLELD